VRSTALDSINTCVIVTSQDATSQVTDERLQDLALIGVTVTDAATVNLRLGAARSATSPR
jgi:hypothetical protein